MHRWTPKWLTVADASDAKRNRRNSKMRCDRAWVTSTMDCQHQGQKADHQYAAEVMAGTANAPDPSAPEAAHPKQSKEAMKIENNKGNNPMREWPKIDEETLEGMEEQVMGKNHEKR